MARECARCQSIANSDVFVRAQSGTLFPDKKRNICGRDVLLILGDRAYPLLPWLMKPYSDCRTLTLRQAKFNCQLSRARFLTENAFVHLKGRWRCLLKCNNTGLQSMIQLVAACCIVHNICEVHGDSFDASWQVALMCHRQKHHQLQH